MCSFFIFKVKMDYVDTIFCEYLHKNKKCWKTIFWLLILGLGRVFWQNKNGQNSGDTVPLRKYFCDVIEGLLLGATVHAASFIFHTIDIGVLARTETTAWEIILEELGPGGRVGNSLIGFLNKTLVFCELCSCKRANCSHR